MHVLVVKTSSLGDLLHTLPALSDAQANDPGLHFDWLSERAFAEIPQWHPAVERVISCDLRSWRRRPLHTLAGGDWSRFRGELRETPYDLVIDAQGLVKSALLARCARGLLAGPDRHAAREPLAAWFYARRYALPAHDAAHAVDRMRLLFAQALGYPLPDAVAAAGFDRSRFPRPPQEADYAVFLHGTTWPSKRWPPADWQALGRACTARGLRVVLPWGNPDEQAHAAAIAAACGGEVLPRLQLTAIAGWLAHARVVVGVDTGLAQLAAALGTPQISLYGPTLPELTGARGLHQVWLRSDSSAAIDRARPTTVSVARVEQALDALLKT